MLSPLIEETIQAFGKLPGVGYKSAQRMVFYLLKRDPETALQLAHLLPRLAQEIGYCQGCRDFSEIPLCDLCQKRSLRGQICIVASPMDVYAIEESGVYTGRYFVLHGFLSPIDGIGPEDLGAQQLTHIIRHNEIHEVILALDGSIDARSTAHYLLQLLEPCSLKVTQLAQGLPMGGSLEYTDSATLAKAFEHRYEDQF